jgi:transcription antitermination factor NusG
MSEEINLNPWFAVHIRIYKKEIVQQSLRHKGFEVFAPSYTARRVVAGRERKFAAPLFPGYLFCALDPRYRLPVLTVPGVIGILGNTFTPTPIPAEEIEAIRRTVVSGLPFEPFHLLQPGEPVQVQTGPLAGVKGVVVHYKGKCRLVIRVTALNDRAVSVEVDQSMVARLAHSPIQSAGLLVAGPGQYYRGNIS